MNALEIWLKQATKSLSRDSANQVRTEIQEHWKSSEEDALRGGASAEEAGRLALKSLGDPKKANCEYRKVMLTSAEARILRTGNGEARAFCSVPAAKWIFLVAAAAVLDRSDCFLCEGRSFVGATFAAGRNWNGICGGGAVLFCVYGISFADFP